MAVKFGTEKKEKLKKKKKLNTKVTCFLLLTPKIIDQIFRKIVLERSNICRQLETRNSVVFLHYMQYIILNTVKIR